MKYFYATLAKKPFKVEVVIYHRLSKAEFLHYASKQVNCTLSHEDIEAITYAQYLDYLESNI